MIGRHVQPGDRTVETGSGASTVMFVAAGAKHTAVSPDGREHARIRDYCHQIGMDDGGLGFVEAASDAYLPRLDPGSPLDAVFIDGAHRFPHPVVDWHYLSRCLRVGGVMMLDDVPIPSVAVLFHAMRDDPGWEVLETADDRAAAFRKVAEGPVGDRWRDQPFNRGFPDVSFVPWRRRPVIQAVHFRRALRTRLGRRVPAAGKAWRRLWR